METVHLMIFDHLRDEVQKLAMSDNAYRAIRWFIEEYDLGESFELLNIEEEKDLGF